MHFRFRQHRCGIAKVKATADRGFAFVDHRISCRLQLAAQQGHQVQRADAGVFQPEGALQQPAFNGTNLRTLRAKGADGQFLTRLRRAPLHGQDGRAGKGQVQRARGHCGDVGKREGSPDGTARPGGLGQVQSVTGMGPVAGLRGNDTAPRSPCQQKHKARAPGRWLR